MRVLRELPDGYCEAAMTYASEEWMARQVLGMGSAVRVLAPESLANRVRDAAAAALESYQAAARLRLLSAAAAVASWGHLEVTKVNALTPGHLAIIAVLVIVLFGAKRLPDAARSLGKSLRIFKSEVRELQSDNKPEPSRHAARRPAGAVRAGRAAGG